MQKERQLYYRLMKWNPWINNEEKIKSMVGYKREIVEKIKGRSIALVGARRVGKTTILYQLIDKEIKNKKDVLFIPFQDGLFQGKEIEEILSAYMRISGTNPEVLVIDEIQLAKKWQSFIRSEYDRGERKLYCAGSMASLLKGKKAKDLVGRVKEIKVFPMSFREYLHVNGKSFPSNEEENLMLEKDFWEYLEYGGFPSVVLSSEKLEELNELKNHLLILDIAERYGFETNKFLAVFDYICASVGRVISYSSIERRTGISRETVQKYIEKLKEHFIIIEVPYYSNSPAVRFSMPKKYYLIDGGFITLNSFTTERGKLLENYVALQLYSKGIKLYYKKENGREIDLIGNYRGKNIAFNVSLDHSLKREKEIHAYSKAKGYGSIRIGFNGDFLPWELESLKTLLNAFSKF